MQRLLLAAVVALAPFAASAAGDLSVVGVIDPTNIVAGWTAGIIGNQHANTGANFAGGAVIVGAASGNISSEMQSKSFRVDGPAGSYTERP